MEKCAVCKQDIEKSQAVIVDGKYVHFGECLNHLQNIPVTESSGDVIVETELLI